MDSKLHNLDEAVAFLERKAIKTSQGDFVRMEDVRRLLQEEKTAHAIVEEAAPKPKDMTSAKRAVLRDPEVMKNFPPPSRPKQGRAIEAQEPQSSSRT